MCGPRALCGVELLLLQEQLLGAWRCVSTIVATLYGLSCKARCNLLCTHYIAHNVNSVTFSAMKYKPRHTTHTMPPYVMNNSLAAGAHSFGKMHTTREGRRQAVLLLRLHLGDSCTQTCRPRFAPSLGLGTATPCQGMPCTI